MIVQEAPVGCPLALEPDGLGRMLMLGVEAGCGANLVVCFHIWPANSI